MMTLVRSPYSGPEAEVMEISLERNLLLTNVQNEQPVIDSDFPGGDED